MEALAALGLATNIITVADCGLKLFALFEQIRDSIHGVTVQNAGLADNTKDLQEAIESLGTSIRLASPVEADLCSDDIALKDTASRCLIAADALWLQLAHLTESGKARGRTHRPFKQAFKAIQASRKAEDIQVLATTLRDCQSVVQTRLLIAIHRRLSLVQLMPSLMTAQFDVDGQINDVICDALRFPELSVRQEQIKDKWRDTYEWIFQTGCQGQNLEPRERSTWSNFVNWLEKGDSLYWINGKPGSGKSTLMNFICGDDRLFGHLSKWSADCQLIVTAFFFWNLGTDSQKSVTGLLRSVLRSILGTRPYLVRLAFPDHDELRNLLVDARGSGQIVWTERKLLKAIRNLLDQNTFKMCVLIDGLDEFNGQNSHILKILGDMQSAPNVKLCVSSRPELEIERQYRHCDGLRLQDLTWNDRYDYVYETLKTSGCLNLIESENDQLCNCFVPRSNYLDDWLLNQDHLCGICLTKLVVERSEGVFIWARCVTDMLVEDFADGFPTRDCLTRLVEIPIEVHNMYLHRLHRFAPHLIRRAVDVFTLLAATFVGGYSARSALTLLDFVLIDLEPQSRSAGFLPPGWDLAELQRRTENKKSQLVKCCAGLIEITTNQCYNSTASCINEVHFVHRTVKDFIETSNGWRKLCGEFPSRYFNPLSSIVRARSLSLKYHHLLGTKIPTWSRRYELSRCFELLSYGDARYDIEDDMRFLVDIYSRSTGRRACFPELSLFIINFLSFEDDDVTAFCCQFNMPNLIRKRLQRCPDWRKFAHKLLFYMTHAESYFDRQIHRRVINNGSLLYEIFLDVYGGVDVNKCLYDCETSSECYHGSVWQNYILNLARDPSTMSGEGGPIFQSYGAVTSGAFDWAQHTNRWLDLVQFRSTVYWVLPMQWLLYRYGERAFGSRQAFPTAGDLSATNDFHCPRIAKIVSRNGEVLVPDFEVVDLFRALRPDQTIEDDGSGFWENLLFSRTSIDLFQFSLEFKRAKQADRSLSIADFVTRKCGSCGRRYSKCIMVGHSFPPPDSDKE